MNTQGIDTIVVGGGQAGLAISYYLRQQGRRHVALKRASRDSRFPFAAESR
jgi:putative flavoprotein involved in K+ transport